MLTASMLAGKEDFADALFFVAMVLGALYAILASGVAPAASPRNVLSLLAGLYMTALAMALWAL